MIIDLTRDFSAEVHTSDIRSCFKIKFCYSFDCISYGFKGRMAQLLRVSPSSVTFKSQQQYLNRPIWSIFYYFLN